MAPSCLYFSHANKSKIVLGQMIRYNSTVENNRINTKFPKFPYKENKTWRY